MYEVFRCRRRVALLLKLLPVLFQVLLLVLLVVLAVVRVVRRRLLVERRCESSGGKGGRLMEARVACWYGIVRGGVRVVYV